MSKGFMCISRDKLDSWRWRNNMAKNYTMMYLLCKANYKDDWFEKTKVCRGQLVFSYDKLSSEMGMPLQTLRTTLRDLSETKQIILEPTRKWTLLTICEYDDWVINNGISNTQDDTIKDTQDDTKIKYNNKEDNNKEKDSKESKKKEKGNVFVPPTLEEVAAYISEKGYHFDAERFHAYYESNGWKVGKNKMKDWKAACRTWESKRKEEYPSLFESQNEEKDPTIPNLMQYEPDLPYDKTMSAFLVPNKYPELNEDWPYTPDTRPDGARICNGSNGWRWDAANKRWIEMMWIMDKRQWFDR
jgi:hypothetical protein